MADGDASINVIELKAVASTSPTLSPLNRRQLYEFYKVSEADHSMRVLDIDAIPQPFTSDIELSARLRVVSLDSSPRFAALSYVWGDYSVLAPDNLTIRLDDGRNAQIQITPNCREAIQTLGSKFGTITIWIDAVCINQEDVEEKASQILLMEDIYTRAEMVDASVNGMVRALRERQTKDPKDRSFATAAILSRLGIKLAKPDYSKELGEVYRNHFESLLRWDVGLLNLIVDVNRHHIPGVPSWVPMWNEVEKSNWIGAPSRYEHPAEKTSYQSGILHHDTLVVRGQLLGTVKFCSGPFPLIGPGVDDLLALSWDQWTNSQKEPILVAAFQFADWIRYAKNHVATIPRYEASMPELVSGILALRYRNDEPEKFIRRRKLIEGSESCSFKGEIFDSWYRRLSTIEPALLEMIKRERSEELHNNSQPQVFSIPEWDSTSNAVVREQTAKLCNLLSGKRNVFVLDLGYLGSGPEGMQENDEIYWIRGVSVPMVLRRSTEDSIFTVIGPAFVYGFMNRKMVKDNELVSITLG
ncbi:heterokaryon incompatibility protein-domain-containing protein [Hypoxylon fuscum]|nr:heterokaryon incompatibility protein-domain-containing protein [Hypoxylon fuscum]